MLLLRIILLLLFIGFGNGLQSWNHIIVRISYCYVLLKNLPPIFFLLACNIIEHTSPLFSSNDNGRQYLSWVQISIKITIFFFFFLLNFIHFSCMSAFFLSWVMWWTGDGWNTSNRAGIDGGVMSVKMVVLIFNFLVRTGRHCSKLNEFDRFASSCPFAAIFC